MERKKVSLMEFVKKHPHESVLTILYIVGIIGHSISFLFPFMILLTPYTLLLSGIIVLLKLNGNSNVNLFAWCTVTFLVTYITEVIGVKTGLIFGEYQYGEVLGFKLLEVPLIIGFNWVFVILGLINLVDDSKLHFIAKAFIVALGAVFFDYFLEPIAINFGYWSWTNIDVPIRNYAAWFLLAFIFTFLSHIMKVKIVGKTAAYYFLVQLIFFIILIIIM